MAGPAKVKGSTVMREEDGDNRRSRFTWVLILVALLPLMPFLLIGIALIDQEFIRSGVPRTIFKTLGIWDPLGNLFNWLQALV